MPITIPASGVRAGTVAHFAANTPPAGWLACNGAAVSRTLYGALFLAIGTTYGAGDGSTTFNLPDLRGEFIRGHDGGRGVDSGRTFGAAQADALQNITGQFSFPPAIGDGTSGAFARGGRSLWGDVSPQSSNGVWNTFDASRVARTANETRPRNIAMLACIKF